MSMPILKIWQLWHTAESDFIKTNHQFCVETLRNLHNICFKLCTLFGMLSFNITSVFRLFAKGKTFVYMSPCSKKFDNSLTSSIYFSGIDKTITLCQMESEWCRVTASCSENNQPVTCCACAGGVQTHTHTHTHTHKLENYNIDVHVKAISLNFTHQHNSWLLVTGKLLCFGLTYLGIS